MWVRYSGVFEGDFRLAAQGLPGQAAFDAAGHQAHGDQSEGKGRSGAHLWKVADCFSLSQSGSVLLPSHSEPPPRGRSVPGRRGAG